MVGMRRPKKTQVEMVETASQDEDEVDTDTGITGEHHPTLESASTAVQQTHVLSAAAQSKLDAATDAFLEAEMKADALREIATEYDAKMRRLDNGDKLKRRKTTFGASKRTYEAIIWLQHEQLACAKARCAAAEAERDAAKAEMRLNELAEELC